MFFCVLYITTAVAFLLMAVWGGPEAQQAAMRMLGSVYTVNGVLIAISTVSLWNLLDDILRELKSRKKELK